MRDWLASVRFLLLAAASLPALASCGPDPNLTPGCQSGNRSQCVVLASMGSQFGCALLTDHTVWCWGRNDESQLGYPTVDLCNEDIGGGQTRSIACHTFPSRVNGLDHANWVSSGGSFSCALLDDNTVKCWGANAVGQLGNGRMLPSETPVLVSGLSSVNVITTGARHACAIVGGGVMCWGANDRGQLGATTTAMCGEGTSAVPCATTPVMVPGLLGVVNIAAGAMHTCARTGDGRVLCWGDNTEGQLGVGTAGPMSPTMRAPVRTVSQPLGSVTAIVAGAYHTCALRDPGVVYCWGRADHGELGNTVPMTTPMGCTDSCSPVATPVQGLPDAPPIVEFDAGMSDASTGDDAGGDMDATVDMDAAVTMDAAPADARVDARVDARGRDVMMQPSMAPQAISAGDGFACALLADTTIRCWGRDDLAQLGDGVPSPDPQPASMLIATPGAAPTNPLQNAAAIVSGRSASCARLSDGSLRCWGSNQDGALGTGNPNQPLGPVPVGW